MAGVVVCQAVHCAARETVHHLATQGDGEGYKIEDYVPPALWGINWRGLNVKCAMRGGQLERVKLDAGSVMRRVQRSQLTLISLKTKMPHAELTNPGPWREEEGCVSGDH